MGVSIAEKVNFSIPKDSVFNAISSLETTSCSDVNNVLSSSFSSISGNINSFKSSSLEGTSSSVISSTTVWVSPSIIGDCVVSSSKGLESLVP